MPAIHDLDGNIIAETDDTGAPQRSTIWVEGRPVAVVADVASAPEIWQVHTDHLNRPIRMTDDLQAVVWNAQYLPYGDVFAITGSAALDYRFLPRSMVPTGNLSPLQLGAPPRHHRRAVHPA